MLDFDFVLLGRNLDALQHFLDTGLVVLPLLFGVLDDFLVDVRELLQQVELEVCLGEHHQLHVRPCATVVQPVRLLQDLLVPQIRPTDVRVDAELALAQQSLQLLTTAVLCSLGLGPRRVFFRRRAALRVFLGFLHRFAYKIQLRVAHLIGLVGVVVLHVVFVQSPLVVPRPPFLPEQHRAL